MRVIVLGGTVFIGRAVVEALLARGHEPLVVHRGVHEPGGLPDVEHLHADRFALGEHRAALERFGGEGCVDLYAMTRRSARDAWAALGPELPLVVASSMDVYRAFGTVLDGGPPTDAVPLDESSPVRSTRYPYAGGGREDRGGDVALEEYEKLDVEEEAAVRRGVVCRLPVVYGPWDSRRREGPLLDRVAAGRRRIPVGTGGWTWTRGWVGDVALGLVLALERWSDVAGETFNLGELQSLPWRAWADRVLAAAGAEDVEFVRVPDDAVPSDLSESTSIAQPILVSSAKATARLGLVPTDPNETLRASVAWHLDHPPVVAATFDDDESALAAGPGSARAT